MKGGPLRRLAGTVLALAALPFGPAATGTVVERVETVEICFTPGEDCAAPIIKAITGARSWVDVQAYSFTHPQIAAALVAAHRRGIRVRAVLDKSHRLDRYSVATFLANAGVAVYIDAAPAIAHNKVLVVDGELVVTGSFNLTRAAAEQNAENVVVLRDRRIAAAYAGNIARRLASSETFR